MWRFVLVAAGASLLRNAVNVAPDRDVQDPELASLTPPQFLLISSPMEKKVSYCVLNNSKAVGGRVHALIDSGLLSPQGIAVDQARMSLYVADLEQQKIFRYKLVVMKDSATSALSLLTVGVPLVIVEKKDTNWVAVDFPGNVYFSEKSTNRILKVSRNLITDLEGGVYAAKDLVTETEIQLVASDTIQQNLAKPIATPPPRPYVLALYDAASDPNTSAPQGVATNGKYIFWANGQQGDAKGSVVRGTTSVNGSPHASEKLTSNTGSARGLCLTDHLAYYTSSNYVFATPMVGGAPVQITQDLQLPRGCVWDGDGTVYISDGGASSLFSFPSGVAEENQVPQLVVEMHDPFGVALLSRFEAKMTEEPRAKTGGASWLWSFFTFPAN
eukprot:GEMP01039355.1.p1 GENE.GEMP01039355.1~~GEMP01039355.1.p1  ORF type:complete len:386 (+),score=104.21 GEMP01039355.1:132-1289(+)